MRGPQPLVGTMQGVYHNGETLVCSDCHVMHASEQHGTAGEVQRSPFPLPYGDAPHRSLLRKSATTDLCLACHDGMTNIPDVVDADVNQLTERAAGFFAAPEVPNYKGHTLAHDPPSSPPELCNRCHFGGTMATATVACIECHAPHGNMGYRNLQWASSPGYEPEIRALSPTGLTGTTRYEQANVRYVSPAGADGSFREVTNICIDCHHAFMDDSGGYYTKPGGMEHWGRHPGTNTEWGASRPIDGGATSTNPTWWVSGTFATPRLPFIVAGATSFASAGVVDAKNEVFCLTCHKAHGSTEPFALRWHYGGPPQPNTTDGCQQCHKDR